MEVGRAAYWLVISVISVSAFRKSSGAEEKGCLEPDSFVSICKDSSIGPLQQIHPGESPELREAGLAGSPGRVQEVTCCTFETLPKALCKTTGFLVTILCPRNRSLCCFLFAC